jgi:phosphopantetheine adenylyltransferase/dephospho-CoA kinase
MSLKAEKEMVEVGLLVLSRRAIPFIAEKLASAAQQVRSRLYVRIDPQRSPTELRQLIPTIYLYASQKCSNLDVRVLLNEKVDGDYGIFLHELNERDEEGSPNFEPKPFKHVCLGGTFDRLHNGHKVLLSTAALLSDKITCGVTGGDMNRKKTLYELIEPLDHRMDMVEEFLKDVTDGVTIDVQEITDPFGPAIVIKDLDCIVVSDETVKGGLAVNQKRKERGLNELDIQKIELVEGSNEILKEVKLSSSSQRYQLLGSLLKPPNEFLSTKPAKPYVIGLTGGIASGKSSISKYLAENGCEIADCDKIVHELYDGNEKFTKAISEEFGADTILNGIVDRKRLGSIVFQDRTKREKLNKIIWPAVSDVIQERLKKTTADIFVIDAALLVEAGWANTVRQLWTVFIPREEAIKRIVERDGISEKDAISRIDSQLSNEARIAASHVVFCSLWEVKETQRQVAKALNHLRQNYIKNFL